MFSIRLALTIFLHPITKPILIYPQQYFLMANPTVDRMKNKKRALLLIHLNQKFSTVHIFFDEKIKK